MIPLSEEQKLSLEELQSLVKDDCVFRENPLGVFRRKLQRALSRLVDTCSRPGGEDSASDITAVNGKHLICCIESFPWASLCERYDSDHRNNSRMIGKGTTPKESNAVLTELLACFKDASLWPPVCNYALVLILLRQVIFYSTSVHSKRSRSASRSTTARLAHSHNDWPSSQKLLFDLATQLTKSQPSLQGTRLHELLRNAINKHEHGQPMRADNVSVAISVVKHWWKELPQCQELHARVLFLDLLCVLEAMVRKNRQTLTAWKDSHHSSALEESSKATPRRSCPSLELLHGELSDDAEDSQRQFLTSRYRRFYVRESSLATSSRKVFAADTRIISRDEAKNQIVSLIPLRSKILKAFISFSSKHRISSSKGTVLLDDILEIISNQDSRTTVFVRVCVLLIVWKDGLAESEIKTLLQKIWLRALKAENPAFLLSFYTELVVEARHFDHANHLWSSTRPFVDYFQSTHKHSGNVHKSSFMETDNVVFYLQSLAFLIAYRGSVLQQYGEFRSLLAQLSNTFDNPSLWIQPQSLSFEENGKLLRALYNTGVFGLGIENHETDSSSMISAPINEGTVHAKWYYDPSAYSTIRQCRSALVLLSPDNEGLFSSQCQTNGSSSLREKKCRTRLSDSSMPTGMCLGEDMIRHILSFLGYKRLLRMRVVSRAWKGLCDDDFHLWMPLFKARFGTIPDDPLLKDSRTLPWKQLFIDRWRAERSIRFGRNKNGWKHRICQHIGCLKVITAPRRLQHHEEVHRRDRAKSPRKKRKSVKNKSAPSRTEAT